MFPPESVKRDPTDIELVEEVSLERISDWLVERVGSVPQYLMLRIQDLDSLKKGLSPIYDELRDGDSIWLCRSRVVGPLHGHEGIALVRDTRPVVYIRIVQF